MWLAKTTSLLQQHFALLLQRARRWQLEVAVCKLHLGALQQGEPCSVKLQPLSWSPSCHETLEDPAGSNASDVSMPRSDSIEQLLFSSR